MVNCPNCGAPIDTDENKCKYCGTSYFDLSCIDFEDCKPIYLKIKINNMGNPMYITQKCISRMGDITISHDTVDVTGRYGTVVKRINRGSTMTTDISFTAIPNGEELYSVEMIE